MKRKASSLSPCSSSRHFSLNFTFQGSIFRLFWTHYCSSKYRKICRNVLREITLYFPVDRLIPGAYKRKIVVFNATTGRKMTVSRPNCISPYSTFCVIDANSAVTFQGESPFTQVIRLDLGTNTTSDFPNTLVCRQKPGLVCWKGTLYAFGGRDNGKYLKSCEKLSLSEAVWRHLPDMPRRVQLATPCQHNDLIYLPSRCSLQMDQFNPLTDSFTSLPMSPYHHNITPPVFMSSTEDMHIMLESSVLQRWKVTQEGTGQVGLIQTLTVKRLKPNCTCEVVMVGKEAVWMSATQAVLVRFRVESRNMLVQSAVST